DLTFETPRGIFHGSLSEITNGPWIIHPKADVAIIPVALRIPCSAFFADKACLPPDVQIRHLSNAYAFGFPLAQGANSEGFSPIAKQAQIASWMTTVDTPIVSRELKLILLDQALAQGYSGAPVFVEKPTGVIHIGSGDPPPLSLVGIVSAQIGDN